MDNHEAWYERVLEKLIDNVIGADVIEEDKEELIRELMTFLSKSVLPPLLFSSLKLQCMVQRV